MEFLMNMNGPALYLTIMVAKVVEVSMSTIRMVYINKGERVIGAILGFVEVMIWLIVVSSVLNNITKDPIKVFIYAASFGLGNYIGVTLEGKIAVGLSTLNVIVDENDGDILSELLREHDLGVTIFEGRGKDYSKKSLLVIQLKRKKIKEIVKLIKLTNPNAFITINDVKSLVGGYVK